MYAAALSGPGCKIVKEFTAAGPEEKTREHEGEGDHDEDGQGITVPVPAPTLPAPRTSLY